MRIPALVAAAALAALATFALATLSLRTSPSPRALLSGHSLQSRRGAGLPISLVPVLSASIGASERSFWPVRHGASLETQGGNIRSTFTASGAALAVPRGTLGLSLTAVGRGKHLTPVGTVAPQAARDQVLYRHGAISEFYRNGPYGLEQAFTLRQRPQAGMGPLVLALSVGGSLTPEQAGSQVLFRTRNGITALRYGQLSAMDATGRTLPARIQLRDGILRLVIDDRDARYPLRIDPLIGSYIGYGEGEFAESVAISSNGNTAVIGGPGYNHDVGAAWVYVRSGSTWTEQAKLTGAGELGEGKFGFSVALSYNGNRALIGAPENEYGPGAAWVFERSGSSWSASEKLTDEGSLFGDSVALSGNGTRALIAESGGVLWFERVSSIWKPVLGIVVEGTQYGSSVALSENGNTGLIGAPFAHEDTGAADLAVLSSESVTKLTQEGESGYGFFGNSVALSANGEVGLVGGLDNNKGQGAAWAFMKLLGSKPAQQKLTGSAEVGESKFGSSVALSPNGENALIGGVADNDDAGAAWRFTYSGSTWTQLGEKLTGGGTGADFGDSVALSEEGTTAMVGGSGVSTGEAGRVWFFSKPPMVVTGEATQVEGTTATLNATVNPNGGEVSECKFEYGTTSSYGSSVPCSSLPGSGVSAVAVSGAIEGLTRHTTYHFRIVASNAGGTSKGSDKTFTTGPKPAVVTEAASSITQTTATLNATVNPTGAEVSACKFEYGTTTAYGSSVSCSSLPGSGESPVSVSAPVTGLTANTTYHFRIVASNSGGTSLGSDRTLKTLPNPPTVVTGEATQVEGTTATLNATVNPNGGEVERMQVRIRHHELLRLERAVLLAARVGGQRGSCVGRDRRPH